MQIDRSVYHACNQARHSLDKGYISFKPLFKSNAPAGFDAAKVYFKTGFGLVLNSKPDGNSFTLTLPAGKTNEGYELFAYLDVNGKPQILGKLDVLTFPFVHQKVCLVPVKVAGKSLIPINLQITSDALNKIYNPYAVAFELSQASVLDDQKGWDYDNDGQLDITGTGLLSNLSDEMKALIGDFTVRQGDTLKSDVSYLFVLNGAKTDENLAGAVDGDMPRGHQFGYLFGSLDVRTLAHELGHGVFKLKHTFDSDYQLDTTNNLMDYTGDKYITQTQWRSIHDLGLVIGVFETEGDAQSQCSSENATTFRCLSYIKYYRNFQLHTSDFTARTFGLNSLESMMATNLQINNTIFKNILISFKSPLVASQDGSNSQPDLKKYIFDYALHDNVTFFAASASQTTAAINFTDGKTGTILLTIFVTDNDADIKYKWNVLNQYLFGGVAPVAVGKKSKIDQIVPDKFFISQGYGDCLATCRNILINFYKDKGKTYTTQTENWVLGTNKGENTTFKIHSECNLNAITDLDSKLNAKIPVIVGVDWKKGEIKYSKEHPEGYYPNQDDGITDHWVLIVGRDNDPKRGVYYTYFEVAQDNINDDAGTSSLTNRFYISPDGYLLSTHKTSGRNGRQLLVTQIRIPPDKDNCNCSKTTYNGAVPKQYNIFNHHISPKGTLIETGRDVHE